MAIDYLVGGETPDAARTILNAAIDKANLVDGKATAAAIASAVGAETAARQTAVAAETAQRTTSYGSLDSRITALDAAKATRAEAGTDRASPGEAPNLWTNVIETSSDAPSPLGQAYQARGYDGLVLRISGAGVVAPVARRRVEPGRVYLVRYAVRRVTDTPDPSGDTVRLAIRWYTGQGGPIGGGDTIIEDLTSISVANGRVVRQALVALGALDGFVVDHVAPSNARGARPYVNPFGSGAVTDVEVIEWTDVTGARVLSPDASALEGRLAAIESQDLAARTAALEEVASEPAVATFASRTAAEAGAPPNSIGAIRALGWENPGDSGVERLYLPEASEPDWQRKVLVDGVWYRGNEVVPPLGIGREYLTCLTDKIRVGASNPAGTIDIRMFGDSTFAEAGAGGGYAGSPASLFNEMSVLRGLSQISWINHAVGGTSVVQMDALSVIDAYTAAIMIKYGINDKQYGLTQFEINLRAALSGIRDVYPMENLSIILIGPNSTNDSVGRDYRWYEQLRRVYDRAARDFQCAFIDIYNYMPDSTKLAGISMDDIDGSEVPGGAVHPRLIHQVAIFGRILDYIMPATDNALWRNNGVRSYPSFTGAPPESVYPNDYPFGISMYRVIPADGWPENGAVITVRQADKVAYQMLTTYVAGRTRVLMRSADVGNNRWNRWTGKPEDIPMINGWDQYGTPHAYPTATLSAEGMVTLQMIIQGGTTTSGTQIGTLPVGLRPATQELALALSATGSPERVRIAPNGSIQVDSTGWSSTLMIINHTFRAA